MQEVYVTPLAVCCHAFGEWRKLQEILDDEGYTVAGDKGGILAHPAAKLMSDAYARYVKAIEKFGMSPAAQAGMPTGKKPEPADKSRRFFA
jgi:P27 family predicted phage terminase small subunit